MIAPAMSDPPSAWRRFARAFLKGRLATVAAAVLAAMVALAIVGPSIAPQDPFDLSQLNIMDSRLPPLSKSDDGRTYWLGTDDQGRDLLSAIIFGMRTSLGIAAFGTGAALALGVIVGLIAAFFGGWLDSTLMRLVDIQLGFPAILTALILIALLGKGVDKVAIALITAQWAYFARTVRGSALVERRKDYVEAARLLKLPKRRIILRHILPNCLPPLIVVATIQVAHAIGLEATLSFLGIGLPVTQPSLGLLVANGFGYVLSGQLWISLMPGLALASIVLSINLVGDRLRDVLNPRLTA